MLSLFSNPRLLRIVALLFFVAALISAWKALQAPPPATNSSQPPSAATVQTTYYAWTLKQDRPAQSAITRDDLEKVEYAVKRNDDLTDLSLLDHNKLAVDVKAGTRLTQDMLTPTRPIFDELPPHYRAVAVSTNEVFNVGEHLKPGDVVDVLYLLKEGRSDKSKTTARRLAERIRVLAVGQTMTSNPDEKEAKKQRSSVRSVVLAVHESLAPTLMLAESSGELRLMAVGSYDLTPQEQQAPMITAQTRYQEALDQAAQEQAADANAQANRAQAANAQPTAARAAQSDRPVGYAEEAYLASMDSFDEKKAKPATARYRAPQTQYMEVINGNQRALIPVK